MDNTNWQEQYIVGPRRSAVDEPRARAVASENDRTTEATLATEEVIKWTLRLRDLLSSFESPALPPYARFYDAHIRILAEVFAAIQRAEPIANALSQLEANLQAAIKDAEDFLRKSRSAIPDNHPLSGNFGLIVVALFLGDNPGLRHVINDYLEGYEQVVLAGRDAVLDRERVLSQIVTETKTQLKVLQTRVRDMKKKNLVDVIEANTLDKKKADLLYLELDSGPYNQRLGAVTRALATERLRLDEAYTRARAIPRLR